jgi:hypothetical protein
MLPRKAWERLPDWLERRECRRPALGHHEVRLRKAVLMLSTSIITLLALIWVARSIRSRRHGVFGAPRSTFTAQPPSRLRPRLPPPEREWDGPVSGMEKESPSNGSAAGGGLS